MVDEAEKRDYHFDRGKLSPIQSIELIPVTHGQITYETKHLQNKLTTRDKKRFDENNLITLPEIHPSFRMIEGEVEAWVKLSGT